MTEELYGFAETETDRVFEKDHPAGRLRFQLLLTPGEIGPYLKLLNDIWGFTAEETIPLHEAVVLVKTGGLFLGIGAGGERAGLVYVMPAHSAELGYHHHSNFMGFVPALRSRGLGVEAKRVHAILARRTGVEVVTWTFDPLQAANASLNFRKLGATCRTYLADLYGGMGGRFDPGLPTDRFMVEWRVDSGRVRERLLGKAPSAEELAAACSGAPTISIHDYIEDDPARLPGADRLLAAVPEGLHELAARDLARARELLLRFRDMTICLLGSGYRVTGMIKKDIIDSGQYYVLDKEDSQ